MKNFLKYFLMSVLTVTVIFVAWRYVPITAAEKLNFCVDFYVDDYEHDVRDRDSIKQAISSTLKDPCAEKLEQYKKDFAKRDIEKNNYEKSVLKDFKLEVLAEVLEEFDHQKAADHLVNRYYELE